MPEGAGGRERAASDSRLIEVVQMSYDEVRCKSCWSECRAELYFGLDGRRRYLFWRCKGCGGVTRTMPLPAKLAAPAVG